jgi:hypothetical protein
MRKTFAMERPISRKAHGLAELSYIPLTALSPELIGFRDDKRASIAARVASGLMLGSALLTRAEWGLFKKVPFRGHLAADAGLSGLVALAPWIVRFSRDKKARNTFLLLGLGGLLIGGLLTRREDM